MLKMLKIIFFCLLFFALFISCETQKNKTNSTLEDITFKDTTVAGGPDYFMEVHHVVLKGSNFEIGKQIAKIAQKNGVQINPSGDRLRNRVQREYLKNNYSIFHDRMRGVAEGYGLHIEDDAYDFSTLFQYPRDQLGCSVAFYPGSFTENGHSILSRNYDFTTGTIQGKRPKENEVAVMSRPYIFEMYPDQGYPSLSLCAFDMLGGVMDGINSEGLTVAILGDDETVMEYGVRPALGIGMHELLSMRYLLDNCQDVREAKDAMLGLKHYYSFIPCHYIIADKHGHSFVFEFSSLRNSTHIIDGEGPQCVTNHLLSNYQSIEEFPGKTQLDSYDRYMKLYASISSKKNFNIEEIKSINSSVANLNMDFDHPDYAPHRTLWHSLYDIEKRSVRVKFYLRDGMHPSENEVEVIEYSDYLTFHLKEKN